jgi:hypothetical protein
MRQSLETTEVAATIVALQERLEAVRKNELERVRQLELSFGPEQQDAIGELTRGIVSRILHGPVKVLESASDDEEPAALLSMVHRVFNLGDRPARRPHQHSLQCISASNVFDSAETFTGSWHPPCVDTTVNCAAGSEAAVVPASQKAEVTGGGLRRRGN